MSDDGSDVRPRERLHRSGIVGGSRAELLVTYNHGEVSELAVRLDLAYLGTAIELLHVSWLCLLLSSVLLSFVPFFLSLPFSSYLALFPSFPSFYSTFFSHFFSSFAQEKYKWRAGSAHTLHGTIYTLHCFDSSCRCCSIR